jgi:hypothetical protein
VAVLSILAGSGPSVGTTRGTSSRDVPPASLLKRSFVFFRPNQTTNRRCVDTDPLECDSLSVTLTLRRPATLVAASINGRVTDLRPGKLGIHADRSSETVFSGVFNPPAQPDNKPATRPGTTTGPASDAEYVKVRLRIVDRAGDHRTTSFRMRRLKAFDTDDMSSTSVRTFGS